MISHTYFHFSVSALALKVHARMLGNMTPFCTKEAFVNIVDTLIRLYKDKTRSSIIPVSGSEVSFKKKSHQNLLHIYKLLVSACRDLPRFWIRYPEMYVTEIVKSMVELAAFSEARSRGRTPAHLAPANFLSLVDPRAKWLQTWLHSKFGRSVVFAELQQNGSLVKLAIQNLNQTLEIQRQSPLLMGRGSGEAKGVLSGQLQTFASLVYNLNVITAILMSRKGLDLINNLREDSSLSVEGFVSNWTSLVCHSGQRSFQNTAGIITHNLTKLLSQDHVVKTLAGNKQFLKTIFLPLIVWEEELKSNSTTTTTSSTSTSRRREAFQTPSKTSVSNFVVINILSLVEKLLEHPTGLQRLQYFFL